MWRSLMLNGLHASPCSRWFMEIITKKFVLDVLPRAKTFLVQGLESIFVTYPSESQRHSASLWKDISIKKETTIARTFATAARTDRKRYEIECSIGTYPEHTRTLHSPVISKVTFMLFLNCLQELITSIKSSRKDLSAIHTWHIFSSTQNYLHWINLHSPYYCRLFSLFVRATWRFPWGTHHLFSLSKHSLDKVICIIFLADYASRFKV